MKKFLLLWTVCLIGLAKSYSQPESHIQTVATIFNRYTQYNESTDSKENKAAMAKSLTALQQSANESNFPVLINVWMYYDPTDFPTRKLIEPIFAKNKSAAITAIKKRIKNRRKSESLETAPCSDLLALQQKLSER